jgi:hypothetical protein
MARAGVPGFPFAAALASPCPGHFFRSGGQFSTTLIRLSVDKTGFSQGQSSFLYRRALTMSSRHGELIPINLCPGNLRSDHRAIR